MNNNSSKQILLSVLGVAILVVAVVGVSFAAFTYSNKGTTENIVSTGVIKMEYLEDDSVIEINDAMPTDEATGKGTVKEGETFDFTITAKITNTTKIDYSIAAEKVTVDGPDPAALDNKDVRLYLEETESLGGGKKESGKESEVGQYQTTAQNSTTGCPATVMELLTDSFTGPTTSELDQTAKKYYRLRMWLADTYGTDDTAGESFKTAHQFKVKVNVYAKGSVVKSAA